MKLCLKYFRLFVFPDTVYISLLIPTLGLLFLRYCYTCADKWYHRSLYFSKSLILCYTMQSNACLHYSVSCVLVFVTGSKS